jgi:hypothetical protein
MDHLKGIDPELEVPDHCLRYHDFCIGICFIRISFPVIAQVHPTVP